MRCHNRCLLARTPLLREECRAFPFLGAKPSVQRSKRTFAAALNLLGHIAETEALISAAHGYAFLVHVTSAGRSWGVPTHPVSDAITAAASMVFMRSNALLSGAVRREAPNRVRSNWG